MHNKCSRPFIMHSLSLTVYCQKLSDYYLFNPQLITHHTLLFFKICSLFIICNFDVLIKV